MLQGRATTIEKRGVDGQASSCGFSRAIRDLGAQLGPRHVACVTAPYLQDGAATAVLLRVLGPKVVLVALLLSALPGGSQAQLALVVGGGGSLPLSTYGEFAELGVQGLVGVTLRAQRGMVMSVSWSITTESTWKAIDAVSSDTP